MTEAGLSGAPWAVPHAVPYPVSMWCGEEELVPLNEKFVQQGLWPPT